MIWGHKPKAIRGEHHDWLLARIKDRDFTLRGPVNELAERGLKVGYRSVWNFVHAEKLSKKSVVAGESDRPDVARGAAGTRPSNTASCREGLAEAILGSASVPRFQCRPDLPHPPT